MPTRFRFPGSKMREVLSTALAKHHANGDTSMVTEIVNLCPIM